MNKMICALALAVFAQFGVVTAALAVVDINSASKNELVALSGIGPAKAQAILDYRKANGPFKTVDELRNVKGIGAKRLEKLRSEIAAVPAAKVAVSAAASRAAGPTAKGEVKAVPDATSRK